MGLMVRKKKKEVYSKAGTFKVHEKSKPIPVPFIENPISNSEITIQVCQGIGDIFWVYQKFAPYFDKINFRCLNYSRQRNRNKIIELAHLLPQSRKSFQASSDAKRIRRFIPDFFLHA